MRIAKCGPEVNIGRISILTWEGTMYEEATSIPKVFILSQCYNPTTCEYTSYCQSWRVSYDYQKLINHVNRHEGNHYWENDYEDTQHILDIKGIVLSKNIVKKNCANKINFKITSQSQDDDVIPNNKYFLRERKKIIFFTYFLRISLWVYLNVSCRYPLDV